MPRYGRTTAAVLPMMKDGKPSKENKKFVDKESQQMVDKVRNEHNHDYIKNKHKEYNPKVDQQRVWSERSPAAYEIPFQSLGRASFIKHPQLQITNSKLPKEEKDKN